MMNKNKQKKKPRKKRKMTLLKHLSEFFILKTLFTLVQISPLCLVRFIGSLIGGFYASLPTKLNAETRERIRLALPELSEKEVADIHFKSTMSIAKTMLEMPKVYSWSKSKLNKFVEFEGQLPTEGTYLILTAHLGQWELIRHYINKCHFPLASIFRKANNPFTDALTFNTRAKSKAPLIAKGHSGSRQLLKTLKEGISLGLLNDQKMSEGIEVTFFGQPAKTASAIAELSLKRKLPIIPVFCYHQGNKFKMEVGDMITPDAEATEENVKALTQQCNDIMEEAIRKHPDQWFWLHKRFS